MAKVDLADIVHSALEAVGYQLWGMEFAQGKGSRLQRVYIDSPEGINIDDCERASRQITALMEVHNPISGEYDLEVSSPGLDRVLFNLVHFKQYLGENIKLVLYQAINNKRRFRAKLLACDEAEETITVRPEDSEEDIVIAIADLAKANLVYDFKVERKYGK